MRHWWLISAVLMVAGSVAVLSKMPLRTSRMWMDPVTGSTRHETTHFGFWSLPATETESALARWAANHVKDHRPKWQFVSETKRGCLWTIRGTGSMPPVYLLHGRLGEVVVASTSDEELAALIEVLREGSDAEQRQAIEAAAAKAIAAHSIKSISDAQGARDGDR